MVHAGFRHDAGSSRPLLRIARDLPCQDREQAQRARSLDKLSRFCAEDAVIFAVCCATPP